MSDKPDERQEREVNDNAGNQYDNPNQEVVGTDITSGAGNEQSERQRDTEVSDTEVSEASPEDESEGE